MSEKYLCENCKKYQVLFDLQHTRMIEATKLWQQETGNVSIYPDLGTLLKWLIDRADKIQEKPHKKMWQKLTKELEKRKISGKIYGITFVLHLMGDIKNE